MNIKSFTNIFKNHCINHNLEKSSYQQELVTKLSKFTKEINSHTSWLKWLLKKPQKSGFYIFGDVGVGKTMIMNLYFEYLKINKKKYHFNEFMIEVHKFLHSNQDKNQTNQNLLKKYSDELKKQYNLIYLDEFQVTNIVDAMILSKLFENIFKNEVIVLITGNIEPEKLYEDGLQREQFLPFISILKQNLNIFELSGNLDFRKKDISQINRFFSPNNLTNNFKINQLFHKITKTRKKIDKNLIIKGRKLELRNFYDGVARFDFNELCNKNIGAEDYIELAKLCKFIVIDNVPNFSNENLNQQQRFITLIDILYEHKIKLLISSSVKIDDFNSATNLNTVFKRTISRIYELTSPTY